MLLPEAKADSLNTTTQFNGGGTQCGEYTNQVITASKTGKILCTSNCRRDVLAFSFNPRDASAL